jgi:hypothetical protein
MNFIVTSARSRGNGIVQYDEIAKVSRIMLVNPGEIMRLINQYTQFHFDYHEDEIMLQTNPKK